MDNTGEQSDLPATTSNSYFNETNDGYNSLDESSTVYSCSQDSTGKEDALLIPMENVQLSPEKSNNYEKIKAIEKKIAIYKREIEKLDEMEVDNDTVNSPYIKSERLKLAIVMLYKELCELTGNQSAKRKEIRLQVVHGHPPGPTRILEAFLNSHICSSKYFFPDFCDVVNCVTEANDKDDLGWTKTQIMKEATLLFVHCGRALQKRRQTREYRDLLRNVKVEDIGTDPADNDPELLAILEENKQISLKKEAAILERYVQMQYAPPKTKYNEVQNNSSANAHELINDTMQKVDVDIDKKSGKEEDVISADKNKIDSKPALNVDSHNSVQDIGNVNTNSCTIHDDGYEPVEQQKLINTLNTSVSEIKKKVDIGIKNNENVISKHFMSKNNNNIIKLVHKINFDIHHIIQETVDSVDTNSDAVIDSIAITSENNTCEKSLHEKDEKNEIDCNNISMSIKSVVRNNLSGSSINHKNIDAELTNNLNHSEKQNSKSKDIPINNILEINNKSIENKSDNCIIQNIKKEPEEELTEMLEGLGENFSVTIEDIEDPFLIIEISSDSSDEE